MVDTILKLLQSDNGIYISSIISNIFMGMILVSAIGAHTWILLIRLLDYKRMK